MSKVVLQPLVLLALNTNRKINARLSCCKKISRSTGKKHKKTHCENQNKVECFNFSFLVLPVTHLRSNPYGPPINKCNPCLELGSS